MLLLMVRIWLKERKQGNKALLPPVLPLVVYHGEKEWKASPRFQDLVGLPDVMGRYVPGFEYLIWDLSRYTAEEVKGGVLLRVAANSHFIWTQSLTLFGTGPFGIHPSCKSLSCQHKEAFTGRIY